MMKVLLHGTWPDVYQQPPAGYWIECCIRCELTTRLTARKKVVKEVIMGSG